MWDQLRRTDVERAKEKLAELRSVTLKKHEEELKQLDADEADIEALERLAETITAKYLNGEPHSAQHTTPIDHQKTGVESDIQGEGISGSTLPIPSPNTATPLRRFMRH